MIDMEMHHRLARAGEWFDLAGQPDCAAIYRHGQQRLHKNIGVAGQAGDKRNAQLQLGDFVMRLQYTVVENNIALMHADVVKSESRRRRVRFRGTARKPVDQVGEVEVLRCIP